MLQLFLLFFSVILAFIFMLVSHPLAMGMILLTQTTVVCLISSQFFQTFWFSYVLFLIFLGGMLVLFIYVISLASNEMFNISLKMSFFFFMFIAIFILVSILSLNFFTPLEMNNEMETIDSMKFLSNENNMTLMKLYNFPSNFITLLLVNYLLLTLIAAVKITNLFYGPLRKMT